MQAYGPADEEESEYDGFDLRKYHDWWREQVQLYGPARIQHFKDQEYFDGDVKGTGYGHWSDAELRALADRKQPPTIRNLVKRKINSICGVEQRGRSEPRALPRTPKDQKSSEVATDSLRFVKERERLNYKKADSLLDGLMIGYAAVQIGGKENRVPIKNIEWKDFFFDPRSRRPDFSDARYLGIAKWVDKDVAIATYVPPEPEPPQIPPQPDSQLDPMGFEAWQQQAFMAQREHEAALKERKQVVEAIEKTSSGTTIGEEGPEWDDRPTDVWYDRTRERIFVVDMWHKDPKKGWFRCVFTGAGKLFTEPANFMELDDDGNMRPTHDIVAFSVYVSKDLWRYGETRDMRPVQDEYNKRLSKALHRLTVARLILEQGAIPDGNIEAARKEAARPDGVIVVAPGKMAEVKDGAPLAAADMEMARDARAYLEMHAGANEQLQGESGGATSGRMFLAMQQAGRGALSTPFNRWEDFEDRIYRTIWFRIQQFWRAPMYVRVTDDKNAARFAAVNGAPVIQQNNGSMPTMGHNGAPEGDPLASQVDPYADDPRMRMAWDDAMRPPAAQGGGAPPGALGMPNMMNGAGRGMADMNGAQPMPMGGGPPAPQEEQLGPMLAELDMDIIVDRAPEAAILQAEQFEQIMQLIQAGAIQMSPDAIIKLSTLPNKSEVLDAMEAEQAKPNPARELAAKKAAADVELTVAQSKKTQAEAITSIGNMQINKRKVSLEEKRMLLDQHNAGIEQDQTEADAAFQRAQANIDAAREQNSRAETAQ